MERVYAIVHGVDVDGICSGAILNRVYPGLELFLCDYPDLTQTLDELVGRQSGRLVIADLNFNQEWRRRLDLFEKLSETHKLNVYDHHQEWKDAQEFLRFFEKSVIDTRRCTTEILADEFLKDDEMGRNLVLFARAQDFNENNTYYGFSEDLQNLISSGFDRREIVRALSEARNIGEIWNTNFERACKEYRIRLKEGFRKLDEMTREYVIHIKDRDVVLVIGFAPEVLYMKYPGNHMREKYPNADLVAAVFDNSAGSVIAWRGYNGSWISVADICSKLGGGGHDFSGGFILGKKVVEKDVNRTLDQVATRLVQNLSN